jgi:hypothetical protein
MAEDVSAAADGTGGERASPTGSECELDGTRMKSMAIRCYIPTTLTALRAGLTDVRAVAPDEHARSLRGEEFETAEFDAMCIAAALAASAVFDPEAEPTAGPESTGSVEATTPPESTGQARTEVAPEARVIVAYDAPDSSPRTPLTAGFELVGVDEFELRAAASFHLDEDAVWAEAVEVARTAGAQAAEDLLGESDLLWYDVTELSYLLGEGEQP